MTIINLNECGDSENLKDLILQLEHLMYGYNYQVTFGVVRLPNCNDLNDCKNKIVSTFENANPDEYEIKPVFLKDFWEEVDFGFNYKGDEVAGLKLSEENEEKLKSLILKYKVWINAYISPKSQFYFYPSYKGIPGCPIFWGYRFIIINNDKESLFIYGSSED